jgi:hypothetical protein
LQVCLHESIIHGHDKHLASILQLGVRNVAGDVRVRACWACKSVRKADADIQQLEWSSNNDCKTAEKASVDSHSGPDVVRFRAHARRRLDTY